MLAAREEAVTAGGRTFTVRRLAELPLARLRMQHQGDTQAFLEALVRDSVVGWGMRENEVLPGGTDDPMPFSADVFLTWVEDEPAIWSGLVQAVLDVMTRHREKQDAALKN